jgi:hypothetical protein
MKDWSVEVQEGCLEEKLCDVYIGTLGPGSGTDVRSIRGYRLGSIGYLERLWDSTVDPALPYRDGAI